MSKVFKTLFFIFWFIYINLSVFAVNDDIKIISRVQWWAMESYRYLDSPEWISIIEKWKNTTKVELTDYQKNIANTESEKVTKANNYLLDNFSDIIWINKVISEENWHKLAWPIAYSIAKNSIVIHHTDSDINVGDDNYDAIRKIYKYHTLTNGWWDIWYNFLIWTNGEIFEWRAWGDFAVWAHNKWNNQSSIWIALIWNYDKISAPDAQIKSLEKLVEYLVLKYNIDLWTKVPLFNWCVWTSDKCKNEPLQTTYDYPIFGHKDAWHTACPWEKLYVQLQDLKVKVWVWKTSAKSIQNSKLLDKIKLKLNTLPENKLLEFLSKVELLLDKSSSNKQILLDIKNLVFNIEKEKNFINTNIEFNSFDDNNKIKVKLSYPSLLWEKISFNIDRKLKPEFIQKDNELVLNFINDNWINKSNHLINVEFKNNLLFINDRKIDLFKKGNFFRISVPTDYIIEVSSWNRKPIWDSTWLLNDNKFRGDIVLYLKDNKLVVVNDVLLSDYLKWLWEVSNSTNPEKVKTIIILARTYARWYMTKARKFAWEWFDASDDPNVFQKYLWFGLEKRSPEINKIVEETKDLVVTYEWDLIKPWYFSSSNWETISFLEYCETAKWVPDCANPEKFPFLLWVVDNGWKWKQKAWHWVWVPWTWVEYFSERWWNFDMITKYFLKWTEIEKKAN